MQDRTIGIALLIVSIALVTCTQLIIKSRLNHFGIAPIEPAELLRYVASLLGDATAWLGGVGLLVGATLWYISLSRVPLSVAFPITALSYPLILAGSLLCLGETVSSLLVVGNLCIIAGVCIIGLSQIA